MPKVTFCTYDKPGVVGGPFSWLARLLPALRGHGIEPRCLVLLHFGESGATLDSLRAAGVSCEAVVCHDRTADRVRWILERLREDPPDVFVPSLPVAGYFAAGFLRSAGIPSVGILHSDDSYYRAVQEEFVFGRKEFRVSAIVCVSRELTSQVDSRGPLTTAVQRIPYGVPLPPESVVRKEGVLRLAYVGRLAEEQKRISEVAKALCRVVGEVSGVTAVLYGDGPERKVVEGLLAENGADPGVRLGGVIPSGQIQEVLLHCDGVVLLSDYEGLPIALMEAMACGCVPVCLRMRSGIPELVDDGVTGLLVDDRGDSFVSAIRRLRDDPELWTRLSRNARESIRQEYSDTVCNAEWAAMLHELHAKAGNPKPIRIPRRIRLPERNPALETAANRAKPPSAVLRFWRRSRILAGKLRRRWFGE